MLEGLYTEMILNYGEIRPYPPFPQETAGVQLGSQAIYRYSLKSSDYPTLIIADDIFDANGNKIPNGYYELALSDNMDFLIIIQTKKPVAIVPVFKIEEDKDANKKPDKKLAKIKKKQEKERKKTNEKRAIVGMIPDEEEINMNASIEYIKNGNYYLIKYERGFIRAWGAIKAD